MTSFTATGTPASGPGSSPRATFSSTRAAAASARSGAKCRNALVFPFSASAKRSASLASSVALKRRAARPSLTWSTVSEGMSMRSAFNHERHFEIAGARCRCVGHGGGIVERRPFPIRAQRGGFAGIVQYLRHRFDVRGIDLVQLVHVAQNLVQVGLELAHFRLGQLEVGQVGDVSHLLLCNLHANAF